MPVILIQRARPDQAGILTEIAFAAKRRWGYPERWIEQWAPLLTITPEFIGQLDVWTGQLEGEVAGFHAVSYNGAHASLEHLWVLPDRMGQGIGRALFLAALQRCRARGCSVLEIEADPNAAGFYEKMGAKIAGEHVYQVDGQPRILPLMEIDV